MLFLKECCPPLHLTLSLPPHADTVSWTISRHLLRGQGQGCVSLWGSGSKGATMGPTANESGPLGVLEHLIANADPLIGEGIPL